MERNKGIVWVLGIAMAIVVVLSQSPLSIFRELAGENETLRKRKIAQSVRPKGMPQPFATEEGMTAVWADFKRARYEIVFDVSTKLAFSIAEIDFEILESGFPLFDSVEIPTEMTLSGGNFESETVDQIEIVLPGGDSRARMIQTQDRAPLDPGMYTIVVRSPIKNKVKFTHSKDASGAPKKEMGKVNSQFTFLDMRDRHFLERYLPTNLEYDQHSIEIEVKVLGTRRSHEVFTSGNAEKTNPNTFFVKFPSNSTCSSIYFHLAPKGEYFKIEKDLSHMGKTIPITVYGPFESAVQNLMERLMERGRGDLMRRFMNRFGIWPHDRFVVYANGRRKGGMEYAGAAESSTYALRHEIVHNYFGRSVFPVNGQSGWFDEAIARWNDYRYFNGVRNFAKGQGQFYENMNLPDGMVQRRTSKKSYAQGRLFFYYVAKRLRKVDKSVDDFLKYFHASYKGQTTETEDFLTAIEEFGGIEVRDLYDTYIRGRPRDREYHKD